MRRFRERIEDQLIDIRQDGNFLLNMNYFNYATGLRMTNNKKWKKLFGIPPRKPESPISQPYCNMALAIQQVTEELMLKLASTARALGNRSILADARNRDMQKHLNLQIKFRESFRPLAPAVLAENTTDFFDTLKLSPYMLIVCPVKEARQKSNPPGYESLSLMEKLYFERSDIPAVTHIDYSARIQTVPKETNPRFHSLIEHFSDLTGYPVIINTSFNVRGEPITCTPEDTFIFFMRTDMDILVMGNCLLEKSGQNNVKELPKFDFMDSLD